MLISTESSFRYYLVYQVQAPFKGHSISVWALLDNTDKLETRNVHSSSIKAHL